MCCLIFVIIITIVPAIILLLSFAILIFTYIKFFKNPIIVTALNL